MIYKKLSRALKVDFNKRGQPLSALYLLNEPELIANALEQQLVYILFLEHLIRPPCL